jgi:hypothetical protein
VGEQSDPAWRDPQLQVLSALVVATLTVGCLTYMLLEGWSLLDAVYFSVVTLATVGYGDLSPKTVFGKLFTMLYIIVGIGILATFASTLARRWVDRRVGLREHARSSLRPARHPRRPRRRVRRRTPQAE